MSYLLADLDSRECVRVVLHTHEHDGRLAGEAAALDWLGAPRETISWRGHGRRMPWPKSPHGTSRRCTQMLHENGHGLVFPVLLFLLYHSLELQTTKNPFHIVAHRLKPGVVRTLAF